jgi:hypothetical protein
MYLGSNLYLVLKYVVYREDESVKKTIYSLMYDLNNCDHLSGMLVLTMSVM